MSRPKKVRPKKGDPFVPGMSARDIEAAGIMSRHEVAQCLALASIPKDELDRLLDSDDLWSIDQLVEYSRILAGRPASNRQRRCPHCGGDL